MDTIARLTLLTRKTLQGKLYTRLAGSSGQFSELVLLEDVARGKYQRVDYAGDRGHTTDDGADACEERVERLRLRVVFYRNRIDVVLEPVED